MTALAHLGRVLFLAIALLLAVLGDTRSANAEPIPCESTGEVYSFDVSVEREDGSTEETILLVVCSKEGYLTIVDSNAESYPDRESFLENNDLFTEYDTLTLSRNFPSPEPGPLESIPGHAPEMGPGWWIAGGGVLALALAGGGYLLWRRRLARKLGEEDRERKRQSHGSSGPGHGDVGFGGAPIGAGRGQGEEDRERETPPYLEGGGTGELFDTDRLTGPPVIGGPDDE